VSNDINNCGQCGSGCHQHETCIGGRCRTTCPTGQVSCNGWCSNLSSDIRNCGQCGVGCHASEACTSGRCVTPCQTGQVACNGWCSNLLTDLNNCGECGKACHQNEVCLGGRCIANACSQPNPLGYSLCGTQGQTPDATQCASWGYFIGRLRTSYSSVKISSSLGGSYSCNNASIASALAVAIKTKTSYLSPPCNGNIWTSCSQCGSGYEIDVNAAFCDACNTIAIRPCWCNHNWGGVDTQTCNPPSQVVSLDFQ